MILSVEALGLDCIHPPPNILAPALMKSLLVMYSSSSPCSLVIITKKLDTIHSDTIICCFNMTLLTLFQFQKWCLSFGVYLFLNIFIGMLTLLTIQED